MLINDDICVYVSVAIIIEKVNKANENEINLLK